MKQIIGNAIRNVRELFVTTLPDFGLDMQAQDTQSDDPLFDRRPLAPIATQGQSSNQEAVLNALARAAELYFLGNVAPLLRNVPTLRWQIKQMQIHETTENMHILTELNKLSPSILSAISKAVLSKLPCANAIDLSQYYGLSIVPDGELTGRAIVTWANLGQDRIAMHFHFDDEIFESVEETPKVACPHTPQTAVAAALSESFRLRTIDANGERDIAVASFPAIVGNSPNADIQVCGQYVSSQHLVLNWDNLLQCVYLTDRSKHGTYLKDGRKLADGERANLIGEGNFNLTDQPDAPRFHYWHSVKPGQGTALLPQEGPTAKEFPLKAQATDSGVENIPTSRRIAATQPGIISSSLPATDQKAAAKTRLIGAARPTMLAEPPKPGPLAWLQVRNAQGKIETVPVNGLPFCIGREISGDGFAIDETFAKVSRMHLRLIEQRGTGFCVNNESPHRLGQCNLTVGEKGTAGKQFVWYPQAGNGGWCVLGGKKLDTESIEVRLLASNSAPSRSLRETESG